MEYEGVFSSVEYAWQGLIKKINFIFQDKIKRCYKLSEFFSDRQMKAGYFRQ